MHYIPLVTSFLLIRTLEHSISCARSPQSFFFSLFVFRRMLNNFGVPSSTSKKQPKRLLQLFHSLTGFKMTITMYCYKTNRFILDIWVLFTYCDISFSSNFSSQEFQLKIIIPLENLVSCHQTVQIMSVADISYALLILSICYVY